MAISTSPTLDLCRWACATGHAAIAPEVRKETVTLLYDQVGCMLASATLPSCQPVVDLVRQLGGRGNCTIVGHPLRSSVTDAALANGTIGQGDEVDATGQHGTGHYAAAIIPAALTVGQHVQTSGTELSRAIAIGSEVAARFQSALAKYGTRNQFAASVGATMGVAVSAGLLLGLPAERMEDALGLAASGACGLSSFHQEPLHQTKSLCHGRAVQAGVLSALLAQKGFHGPREVMTIENGFFDAFLGLPDVGHEIVHGLGEHYLMREVAYKRYPVGGPNQTPLYAFLKLLKENHLSADDIGQIEVSVSRGAFQTVMTNMHPSVHMETILCLAAVHGDITFAHIHDPRYLSDPRVKSFRERVRIFIIPRPGPASKGQRLDMRLTVYTRRGKVLQQNLRFPLMSQAEIQYKFRSLAGLRLDGDRVAALEARLMAIESETDVAALVRTLELPYPGSS